MFATPAAVIVNKNTPTPYFHKYQKVAIMNFLVNNVTWSLRLSLNMLRVTSFWWPRALSGRGKIIWGTTTALSFFCLVGMNIIAQAAELVYVFGDPARMTNILLILITNMTLVFKMVNIVWTMDKVHEIVDEMDEKLRSVEEDDEIAIVNSSDQFTSRYLYGNIFLAFNTVCGLAASARKPDFPLPARYPYDTTKSPAYELTCGFQLVSLNIAAATNIGLDCLVISLISQCCCRLKLLALSLTKLCHNLDTPENKKISEEDEIIVIDRLRRCIDEHQAILIKAKQIQNNFSIPVFAQLTVSSFIICSTAYQLAFAEKTAMLLFSLGSYLTVMTLEVFMYCYQGNELSVQSNNISIAAYECLWYTCSYKIKRVLLILMIRSSREFTITVGGLTILSLDTFTRVIKASYSFFTVLQSTQE